MQLYNCKVRLHGSVLHEVRKEDVTASEIEVLRAIHGPDAVVDITHTGRSDRSRTDVFERDRLNHEYGVGLSAREDLKSLNGIFGVAGKLPEALHGVEHVAAPKAKRVKAEPVPQAPATLDLATDDDLDAPEFDDEAA